MSNAPVSERDTGPHANLDDEAEDRTAILARRAAFIASAIAGLGLAAGCDVRPDPCLSVAPLDGGGAPPAQSTSLPAATTTAPQADPTPCLTFAPEPPASATTARDAGAPDASSDAGLKPTPAPTPTPRPCLKPLPRACLSDF